VKYLDTDMSFFLDWLWQQQKSSQVNIKEIWPKYLQFLLQTRHLMPSGLKKMVVNNVRDVDLLLMHNKSFAAEIAHNVSSRNRITILERCVLLYHVPSCFETDIYFLSGQKHWA